MSARPTNIKKLSRGLGVLQAFIGLGAVGGGLALMAEPDGAGIGMPVETLENSPFSDFLIPGIVLFLVNGVGNLLGATASFKRRTYAGGMAVALGLFLVAWIRIQVHWLGAFHWLHALYIVLGLSEFAMGWSLRKKLRTEQE